MLYQLCGLNSQVLAALQRSSVTHEFQMDFESTFHSLILSIGILVIQIYGH